MSIQIRSIWKVNNVQNGDNVCIFEIPKNLYTINLCFEGGSPIFEIQENCPSKLIPRIYPLINKISEKIKLSEEVLINCDYVFGYLKDEVFLISYAHTGIPFTYSTTLLCGKKIDVPLLNPVWRGILTYMTPYAFLDDIFILKD